MKPVKLVVVALLTIMLSAAPAFAASPHGQHDGNQSQALSLGLLGVISDAGTQHYEMSGGQLVQGTFGTNSLSGGHVSFNLDATVQGLGASGKGSLQISSGDQHGTDGGNNGGNRGDQSNGNDGQGAKSLEITITGMVPAASFPFTVDPTTTPATVKECDPNTQLCNSEIPLMFTGFATLDSGDGGDPAPLPIGIESPYWSPLGGPILIASLDNPVNPKLSLVVTYDEATIEWSGVQLQGVLSGTLGTNPIAGTFSQTTNSFENLVSGKEHDSGMISFATSDPTSVLNSQGPFHGHSFFDRTGSFDCTAQFNPLLGFLGLPLLPSGPWGTTCTATGLTSNGSFSMEAGHDTSISGKYHTDWGVPALLPMSTVTATVSQH